MFVPRKILEEKLLHILAEDVGQGDVTTSAIVPKGKIVEAAIIAKDSGIVAGIEETVILAEALGLEVEACASDGVEVKKRETFLKLRGDAQTILASERTLLNLLSRMSGIATTTRRIIERLRDAKATAKVAASRKSAPGMLYFDKKATLTGGGDPHRMHLDDLVLIKDNHLVVIGDVVSAVEKAKKVGSFTKKIEVEVTKISDALAAVKAGADIVMLDNFSPRQAKKAVDALKKAGLRDGIIVESSGGITEATLPEYASAGVDIISLGELTHSVKAFNVSLEIERVL